MSADSLSYSCVFVMIDPATYSYACAEKPQLNTQTVRKYDRPTPDLLDMNNDCILTLESLTLPHDLTHTINDTKERKPRLLRDTHDALSAFMFLFRRGGSFEETKRVL